MRRALVLVAAAASPAFADGFRIQQGGPSIGNAGAGAAATADDPCTVFFNPAGMTELERPQTANVVNAIDVSAKFRDGGTRGGTGLRPGGGDGREAGGITLAPGLFAVVPVGERTAVGLGVVAPFGLGGDYGDHWVGRYFATRTWLETLDVSPCVAWRADERLSLGFGLDVQFLRADFENAIDFGTVAVDELGASSAAALGLEPGRDDGRGVLKGESVGFGWNVGALWKPDDATRVGLALRSVVKHDVEGDATFVLPKAALAFRRGGVFEDTGVSTRLDMPETLNLGVVRALSPRLDLVADLDWTRWRRFDELDIEFDNPRQTSIVETERWRNGVRPSLGATWRPDGRWTLRAGAAWDEAVAPDKYRRPRAPDQGRLTFALGVGLRVSDSVSLDFECLHAWFREASFDVRAPHAGRLVGTARSAVDYFSFQATVRF